MFILFSLISILNLYILLFRNLYKDIKKKDIKKKDITIIDITDNKKGYSSVKYNIGHDLYILHYINNIDYNIAGIDLILKSIISLPHNNKNIEKSTLYCTADTKKPTDITEFIKKISGPGLIFLENNSREYFSTKILNISQILTHNFPSWEILVTIIYNPDTKKKEMFVLDH
jgi:hypothetical protein